jgi:ABC-type polysaccharide/polyol phosphate export permease
MLPVAFQSRVGAGPESLAARLWRLCQRRETIAYLVSANLKAGHRNKVLGNLWNLLDPLLSLGVYYLVFGVWLSQARHGASAYLIYLFTGVLAWRFLDGTASQAVNCIRNNRGLINEINFPKAVFPISICLSRLYDFLWGLLVLGVALVLVGTPLSKHMLWIVPLIFIQLLFTLGVAYIVAYLGAFFADTANIITVVLRLGFYASPILYYVQGPHATRIPERYVSIYMLNPMACLMEGYRAGLTRQQDPDQWQVLYVLGVALIVLIAGYGLFSRGEGKFAKYV